MYLKKLARFLSAVLSIAAIGGLMVYAASCSAGNRNLDAFMGELAELMERYQAKMYRTPVSINFQVDDATAEWRGLFGNPKPYEQVKGAIHYDDPCRSMLTANNDHWRALLRDVANVLREESCATIEQVRALCQPETSTLTNSSSTCERSRLPR